MVDVWLFDGGWVNVVIELLLIDGLVVLIWKFCKDLLKFEDLLGNGIYNEEIGWLFEVVVDVCCNVFVLGGISLGKILLLNVLVFYILMVECVVMIEDMVELLLNYLYVVWFESCFGGFDGSGVVMICDLL